MANDCNGFTLLEVLISIAVLVFISLAIYNAVTETYKLRDTLSSEGDFHNGIRLAMTVLGRDVEVLYSPVIMLPSSSSAANANLPSQPPAFGSSNPNQQPALNPNSPAAQLATGELAETQPFWAPAVDITGVRPSRFVGTENKLSFVSASHLRVYKETPETEFAKVSYELIHDDASPKELGDLQILLKTESPDVYEPDERKDKFQQSYKLLYGVKSLKFRYYRLDQDKWTDSWDNTTADYKNLYPDRVEVHIEVKGPDRLSFEGLYLFKPEIPLHGLFPTG